MAGQGKRSGTSGPEDERGARGDEGDGDQWEVTRACKGQLDGLRLGGGKGLGL
jgi:hypothetical protein